MLDTLRHLFQRLASMRLADIQASDWMPLLVLLLISCAASITLALMYSVFFERRSTGSDIHRAFPALGTAITGIFICLQFSLPLSLGLLGALSIVRFRTPIKEPEEIGFLMLLIASSICTATLNFTLLVMLLLLAVVTLSLMRWLPWFVGRRTAVASLVITTTNQDFRDAMPRMQTMIRAQSRGATLDAVTECDGMTTATITLFSGNATQMTSLQAQLRQLLTSGEVSLFVQRPRPL
ncbi:MAG: DUF4956 domain-containing protein [Planctomycetes bacterium]|nr:DUF4956 domain-containing protein [Planctomycetota bacterium]